MIALDSPGVPHCRRAQKKQPIPTKAKPVRAKLQSASLSRWRRRIAIAIGPIRSSPSIGSSSKKR